MLINRLCRRFINIDLIKKQNQQKLITKQNPLGLKQYPKTFSQKIILLSSKSIIQHTQIFQFGVKYKEGNSILYLSLIAIAFFIYFQSKKVPCNVNDMYLRISAYSPKYKQNHAYLFGYIFAALNFGNQLFYYLPLTLSISQITKFIPSWQLLGLIGINIPVSSIRGQQIVNQKLQKYQVWQNQYINYGQGTFLSIGYALWSGLGFKNGLTHLKSRIFLKAIKGIGIKRAGIPIGYLCLLYTIYQLYLGIFQGKKNFELSMINICTGIFFGLVLRRFNPIIK